MLETALPRARTISEQGASARVYRPEAAPLRLADGTPLYLEWIIEGEDGTLYKVPAEPCGWLRRSPYEGERNKLRPVPPREASIIVRLTSVDPADAADGAGVATAGYLFRRYRL